MPGLRPKPEPKKHKVELLRCLHEGVARINAACAEDMRSLHNSFELIAWTFPFYGVHHDIEPDRPGIEALLKSRGATERDRADAKSSERRFLAFMYSLADRLPFEVPPLGNENLELHLKDLRRYIRNQDGVADKTRAMLKAPLIVAARENRPVLLIGHSMGSVISYDALWQLSYESNELFALDTFLTVGSPLGQNRIRRQLLGQNRQRDQRYPRNIRNWTNIFAVGDLTALEMRVLGQYSEMLDEGVTSRLEDHSTYTYFRNHGTDGKLNVHSEYGYLVNETTARVVTDWWVEKRKLI